MSAVTLAQLLDIMPLARSRAAVFLVQLNAAMAEFAINTPARQASFLSQIGHESGQLVYVRELWGPTPSQLRYERDFTAAWPPRVRTDRNQLPAVGIEGPEGETVARKWLAQAKARSAWLILYTHDVRPEPSPWGCTPEVLARLLDQAVADGFDVVTVREGARRLGI